MRMYEDEKFIRSITNGDRSSSGEIGGIEHWIDPNYGVIKKIPMYYMGRVLIIINILNNI